MSHLASHTSDRSSEDSTLAGGDEQTEQLYSKFRRHTTSHYFKTPCDHEFHIDCLISWMRLKMDCPTCRRELPLIL